MRPQPKVNSTMNSGMIVQVISRSVELSKPEPTAPGERWRYLTAKPIVIAEMSRVKKAPIPTRYRVSRSTSAANEEACSGMKGI